jgi:DNA-binding CsgD family transcriptional regulator
MDGKSSSTGLNYLQVCDATKGPEKEEAQTVADGIRSVIRGEREIFLYDYPCHSPEGKHWYYMRVVPMKEEEPARVVVSHEDITALKLTEEALRKSRQELLSQKKNLEETNIAMKVLLKQRESDRFSLERKVLLNIRESVLPHLEKVKGAPIRKKEKALLEIVESHLNDITSPFLQRFSVLDIVLTPQEMQVASLVRDGKTGKEIADILNVSETTVHFHRRNLRKKLGLKNRKQNLRTFLLSMTEHREPVDS